MAKSPVIIAHVLHRLYLAGAEVLAADLARQVRSQHGDRFRFVFLCLDELGPLGRTLEDEGFAVVDLKRKPGVDWSVARRLRGWVKHHRIDLLHAHQYTPFFYAAVSRAWRTRPPILFTEHGRHYPDYRRPKRVLANRFLLRRHDRVTAVGQFVKQALVAHEGIAGQRVDVVYNGINPSRFTSDQTDATRAAARAELQLSDDQMMILQVARFHPVKDHATCIKAFAQVVPQAPQAVLCFAGDGEDRDKAEALAGELGVAGQVRFLGVREDIPRWMAAADVFVLSSLSEGVSVTLLEAMASRLAIACTDVGGNGEVVAHQQTGLLSPRRDDQALAKNLLTLLQDAPQRRRMGEAGWQRLMELFTQQRMHEAYLNLYQQMLPG